MSLAAVRLARGWWITRQWATGTLPADTHPGLHAIYLEIPAELRRGVSLHLTADLAVPTLVGVFQPQIWLPSTLPDSLLPAELHYVLLHELGHARRRDLLAQWLCALACCLHWFNPFVWLLANLARTDRELACDGWVLSQNTMKIKAAASYGHTLLKVVAGICHGTPRALPVVPMAAGIRHLGLRVREIGAFRPVAPWSGRVALAATAVLVAACTLKAAPAETGPTPADPLPQSVPPAPAPSPASPVSDSPAPVAPKPPVVGAAKRPVQVEIEGKFIEMSKATALEIDKAIPSSSPIATVLHQVFARFAVPESANPSTIFRSSLISADQFQLLVRQLNEAKGVDLLSAPRVTTKSEQKATIEIIREFLYATAFERGQDFTARSHGTPISFEKANTGLTLEVQPTIESKGNLIDLSLTWKITNFDGFVDADGQPIAADAPDDQIKFPTFDTHSVSTVATLSSGATVAFSTENRHVDMEQSLAFLKDGNAPPTGPKNDDERVLVVFITATLVEPPGPPSRLHYRVIDSTSAASPVEPPPGVTSGADEQPHSAPDASQPGKAVEPLLRPVPAGPPATPPTTGLDADPSASPALVPYGVPVEGKPGFVTSPYSPDAGFVDLRGYKRGQFVVDPYTGKVFLVP